MVFSLFLDVSVIYTFLSPLPADEVPFLGILERVFEDLLTRSLSPSFSDCWPNLFLRTQE